MQQRASICCRCLRSVVDVASVVLKPDVAEKNNSDRQWCSHEFMMGELGLILNLVFR